MENNISTAWFRGLDTDTKEAFKTYILNSYDNSILIRLKEIVIAKRLSLEASERSPEIYTNANWSFMQAHNNGANQTLKWMEELLSFTK